MNRIAIVLLSGGLDSATVLALARAQGLVVHCLAFDYGQRHRVELECSVELAQNVDCTHLLIKIDQRLFRGTALVDTKIDVPAANSANDSIPVTYVPGRNILFLAHALSYAESVNASEIHIGVNALDYSGYPDCRPDFIAAFQEMAGLGMKVGVQGRAIQIKAPLIHMSKNEIIASGLRSGVDYARTSSCYNPERNGQPCLKCDSCYLRMKGFAANAMQDPLLKRYKLQPPELD